MQVAGDLAMVGNILQKGRPDLQECRLAPIVELSALSTQIDKQKRRHSEGKQTDYRGGTDAFNNALSVTQSRISFTAPEEEETVGDRHHRKEQ